MYVENVHLYNIDRLFNICAFVLEQKDMVGKTFEKNLTEIYNQMSVTFKISTLSFMEYFHMKYMLEDGAVEKMEPVFSMSYVNTVYPEISSTVRQLHRMMNTGFENVILPACFSGITTVTISGRDLYMIFKSDPMREFFVKVIPEDKLYDEDHKFNVNVIDEMFKNGLITDANIEEMFANTFLTNFYTSMMRNHE